MKTNVNKINEPNLYFLVTKAHAIFQWDLFKISIRYYNFGFIDFYMLCLPFKQTNTFHHEDPPTNNSISKRSL